MPFYTFNAMIRVLHVSTLNDKQVTTTLFETKPSNECHMLIKKVQTNIVDENFVIDEK